MNSQCAVYPKNPVFSNSKYSCNHVTLGLPIDTPKPLREAEYTSNVQPTNVPYLQYSKPHAQKVLDQRTVDPSKATIFPRNIYAREPLAGGIENYPLYSPLKNRPRDINIRYSYSKSGDKERSKHPEYSSRFGYDRFPNEYGVGEQSRGYVEPPSCHSKTSNGHCGDLPTGMAPNEFYEESLSGIALTDFRVALKNYYEGR